MKVEDQVSLIKGVPNCTGLPVRQISNQGDLDEFLYSETFKKFYSFIQSLGEAVKGRRISDCSLATTATSLVSYQNHFTKRFLLMYRMLNGLLSLLKI